MKGGRGVRPVCWAVGGVLLLGLLYGRLADNSIPSPFLLQPSSEANGSYLLETLSRQP